MRRPSPSLLVSFIALFVALGGTGYAAAKLARNSVGAKQIKRGAVGSSEVKNGSLSSRDFGSVPKGAKGDTGPAGPAGAAGSAGPAGTALAWARVASDGRLLDGSGLKFLGRGDPFKVYCFDRTAGPVRAVVATTDAGPAEEGTPDPLPIQLAATVSQARINSSDIKCPAGTDFFVAADKIDGTRSIDAAFYVAVIA